MKQCKCIILVALAAFTIEGDGAIASSANGAHENLWSLGSLGSLGVAFPKSVLSASAQGFTENGVLNSPNSPYARAPDLFSLHEEEEIKRDSEVGKVDFDPDFEKARTGAGALWEFSENAPSNTPCPPDARLHARAPVSSSLREEEESKKDRESDIETTGAPSPRG